MTTHNMKPATTPPMRENDPRHQQPVADPGHPTGAGYAERRPAGANRLDTPHPDAAGNEAAQVASQLPIEEEAEEPDTEPTPPGEHKREPIKDPDPADTKLHVQSGSR